MCQKRLKISHASQILTHEPQILDLSQLFNYCCTYTFFEQVLCCPFVSGPNGLFSFMSRIYGGRITDNQMVTDCGIIEKVEHGDEFMADKGFPKVRYFTFLRYQMNDNRLYQRTSLTNNLILATASKLTITINEIIF